MAVKDRWAKETIERIRRQLPETAQQIGQAQPWCGTMVKKWAFKRWSVQWDRYLDTVPVRQRTPAHGEKLGKERSK